MSSQRVVDSRLYVSLDLGSALRTNATFAQDASARGHLALQLLIYDTIVIPTKDFGIVPILVQWMGRDPFRDALRAEAFTFLHLPHMLGYAGNGLGISSFLIQPSKNRPFQWWQAATFGDAATAVELQVANGIGTISRRERAKLSQTVMGSSRSLSYSNDEFMKNIAHESYTDIMHSPKLSALVSLLSGNPEKIDLTRVSGVEPNQMRVSHSNPIRDAADVVLRVAEMNLSLFMAAKSDEADLLVPNGADLVLRSKLARAGIKETTPETLVRLLELTKLPDPSIAVARGRIPLSKIWEVRQSGNSRKFRAWLRDIDAHEPRELERAYVESFSTESFVKSLPARALRFLVTTGIGIVHPIAGLAASAADTFFMERLLQDFRPKLFIDDLRSLLKEA
jgi:hypothetical protein